MSLEHSPAKATDAAIQSGGPSPAPTTPEADLAYWNALIDERAAGDHIGLTDRTMQKFRQQGGGPPYIVISSRCIRYRRRDLEAWANARLRTSTSDPGQEPSSCARQKKTPAVGAPPPGSDSFSRRRSAMEAERDEPMRKTPLNQA